MKSLVSGILVLALVLIAGMASAEMDNGRERVERAVIAEGIKLYPTTTTNFADPAGYLRFERQLGGGDAAGGESGDAGAAAGATGGNGGDSGTSGEGCSR